MKSHGKSKAVIAAVIFEVNSLQSSRFGDALRVVQDHLDSKNYYAFNPAVDLRKSARKTSASAETDMAAKPE